MLVTLLTLPLAPLRGVTGLARVIRDQAERELYDPSTAMRQLEELEAAARAGQLSEDELAQARQTILDRLMR